MAVLDQIMGMKKQGMSTPQIMQGLKERGITPKEINEALSQSEIKAEIDFQKFPQDQQTQSLAQQNSAFERDSAKTEGMQPSIGSQQNIQVENEVSQEQEMPSEQEYPQYSEYQEYSPNQNYQQYQDQYQEYQPPQATDIETINDIALQLIEEKTKLFKKDLDNFSKFKLHSEERIKEIDKRLMKIESTLEELQLAIIRKIGSYGEDIKNISKEIKSTQESFSKILDPLTDNIRELQKITGVDSTNLSGQKQKVKHTSEIKRASEAKHISEAKEKENRKSDEKEKIERGKKLRPSFEDYLR
ncbi:MAG: hypothetical protein AABX77_02975 [Nanoarchaeota archaeon]